jgi:hypothetical protein
VIRLRLKSKAPVAVAGILAVPLFFVALMAFSLRIDKPSQTLSSAGKAVFGDPAKGTIGTIYALALAVGIGLALVGVLASLLRSRLAVVIPAAACIVATILLLIPLGAWAARHTARYPLGTDNIPDHSAQNLMSQGEWEQGVYTTAHQVGWVTIGVAAAAIVLSVAFEIRRRRGGTPLLLQPTGVDAELASGGAPQITGGG